MVTFDGTYYLRYSSWVASFPFGYPLIIEFFKIFISDEVFAASFAAAFFGSALLIPLSQILIHLFSKKIGLLLLLVAAFNPVVIYYSSVTYSEMPLLFAKEEVVEQVLTTVYKDHNTRIFKIKRSNQ